MEGSHVSDQYLDVRFDFSDIVIFEVVFKKLNFSLEFVSYRRKNLKIRLSRPRKFEF